jgi:hypothetical protein
MERTFNAEKINVGFHPAGYKIDKTATPMNRYTKCDILPGNHWCNPKPVCFDSLPQQRCLTKDKFNWNKVNFTEEQA